MVELECCSVRWWRFWFIEIMFYARTLTGRGLGVGVYVVIMSSSGYQSVFSKRGSVQSEW